MFNVWNGLTNGTLVVPIFQVTTIFFTTVHVGGGVRTTVDSIVTRAKITTAGLEALRMMLQV